jgi:hypothetical protein
MFPEIKIFGIEIPFIDMVRFIFWSTLAAIPTLIFLGVTWWFLNRVLFLMSY